MSAEETKKLVELAAVIAAAGACYLGPFWSRDVANHVVMWEPGDLSPEKLETELRRRMQTFGMPCGDVEACARAMLGAHVRGSTRPEMVAAAKSGPAWGLSRGQWIAAKGSA